MVVRRIITSVILNLVYNIFLLSSKKSLLSNSKSGKNLFKSITKNIKFKIGINNIQYFEDSIPSFNINKSEIKNGENGTTKAIPRAKI